MVPGTILDKEANTLSLKGGGWEWNPGEWASEGADLALTASPTSGHPSSFSHARLSPLSDVSALGVVRG